MPQPLSRSHRASSTPYHRPQCHMVAPHPSVRPTLTTQHTSSEEDVLQSVESVSDRLAEPASSSLARTPVTGASMAPPAPAASAFLADAFASSPSLIDPDCANACRGARVRGLPTGESALLARRRPDAAAAERRAAARRAFRMDREVLLRGTPPLRLPCRRDHRPMDNSSATPATPLRDWWCVNGFPAAWVSSGVHPGTSPSYTSDRCNSLGAVTTTEGGTRVRTGVVSWLWQMQWSSQNSPSGSVQQAGKQRVRHLFVGERL